MMRSALQRHALMLSLAPATVLPPVTGIASRWLLQ
jgi:hypothetical protein